MNKDVRYLRVGDVAERYQVKATTVRRWMREGLPFFKAGHTVRIDPVDLDKFHAEHTVSTVAQHQ